MLVQEIVVEFMHDLNSTRVSGDRELHLKREGVQNLVRRYTGIGEVNGFHILRKARLQHTAEHGLAAADLTGDFYNAFTLRNCVDQRLQYGAAVSPFEKHSRVGRDFEGRS